MFKNDKIDRMAVIEGSAFENGEIRTAPAPELLKQREINSTLPCALFIFLTTCILGMGIANQLFF